jgi:hypothetical protein
VDAVKHEEAEIEQSDDEAGDAIDGGKKRSLTAGEELETPPPMTTRMDHVPKTRIHSVSPDSLD